MKYAAVELSSHESAEALSAGCDASALAEAVIGLALADSDVARTTSFFLRMATHSEPGVRGAALLGFGHLARRFRAFPDAALVAAAIDAALEDTDPWVRGQAVTAHDDFATFIVA